MDFRRDFLCSLSKHSLLFVEAFLALCSFLLSHLYVIHKILKYIAVYRNFGLDISVYRKVDAKIIASIQIYLGSSFSFLYFCKEGIPKVPPKHTVIFTALIFYYLDNFWVCIENNVSKYLCISPDVFRYSLQRKYLENILFGLLYLLRERKGKILI